jgi:hypothetical protein
VLVFEEYVKRYWTEAPEVDKASLQEFLLFAEPCTHACTHTRVIDTMYQLIYSSAQTRAWRIDFRIDIFPNIRHGQKDEFGKLLPELAFLTVPNIREYFYMKIRLCTPTLSALLGLAGQMCMF